MTGGLARDSCVSASYDWHRPPVAPGACSERTEIINAHVRQKKDMNDMIAAMEAEFNDAENELRQEFEAQREEIKNRNSEEYNVLKIQLEGIIEVGGIRLSRFWQCI